MEQRFTARIDSSCGFVSLTAKGMGTRNRPTEFNSKKSRPDWD